MAILNSKFDVQRGYPNGSAMPWPFKIKKVANVPVALKGGDIVTQELQGLDTVVDKATSPADGQAQKQMWLVVEGNDDFSGQFTEGVNTVLITSGVVWQTSDVGQGVYNIGDAVTVTAGQINPAGAFQSVAYVLENHLATTGVLVLAGK